jgi:hypothetical protein
MVCSAALTGCISGYCCSACLGTCPIPAFQHGVCLVNGDLDKRALASTHNTALGTPFGRSAALTSRAHAIPPVILHAMLLACLFLLARLSLQSQQQAGQATALYTPA